MAKNLSKWDAAIEVAESIYTRHKLDATYGRQQANEDFDLYSYSVINAACSIADVRLNLDGEDSIPW